MYVKAGFSSLRKWNSRVILQLPPVLLLHLWLSTRKQRGCSFILFFSLLSHFYIFQFLIEWVVLVQSAWQVFMCFLPEVIPEKCTCWFPTCSAVIWVFVSDLSKVESPTKARNEQVFFYDWKDRKEVFPSILSSLQGQKVIILHN